ncbi:MAG TPA: hypothetical protein DDW30_06160 [Clostridiales bacterium]|nr:hypothetical protein [Clostridiales bacterium]
MNERRFSPIPFDALCERLTERQDTLLLLHRNPDGDAVGSAFALRELLTALGSRAWCVCESELPERLRFLSAPAQGSVLPESVPADFSDVRVISADVASPAQLGALRERFEARTDFMIDHHGTGTPFADFYTDPRAAATGEIVFDIIRRLEQQSRAHMTPRMAELLYAAISSDTGCFRYSNVTPDTHRRAAELVAIGIDCADINHRLFDSKPLGQLRAEAMGVEHLRVSHSGRVALIAVSYAERLAAGLEDCDLETLVDVARSLAGVEVAISLRQPTEEGIFRASVRSSGAYNVAALCAKFSGGGHEKAAGCTVYAPDIESAAAMLLGAIDN